MTGNQTYLRILDLTVRTVLALQLAHALDNLEHVSPDVDWSGDRSYIDRILLADAQTSGGLLIAMASDEARALLKALRDSGAGQAAVIGRFQTTGRGRISV